MTKFQHFLFQSTTTSNISKRVWFDPRYLSSITVGILDSQSDISALNIALLPRELWPKIGGESKFAYFFEGTLNHIGSQFPFSPTERSLWINSASVIAIESFKGGTRLYLLPPLNISIQSTGVVVIRPSDPTEIGHFIGENPPAEIAKMLDIELED